MWFEKLARGILELDTPIGPRYLQPNLLERMFLLWTFRHFFSLPQQVLQPRERRLVDRLCLENRFVSLSAVGSPDRPVIGKIEKRAPAMMESLPPRKSIATSQSSVSDQGREAASA